MSFIVDNTASIELRMLLGKISNDFTLVLNGTSVKFQAYKIGMLKALRNTSTVLEKEELCRVCLLVLKEQWVTFRDQHMRAERAP